MKEVYDLAPIGRLQLNTPYSKMAANKLFFCLLISPLCLVNMYKKQNKILKWKWGEEG